MNRNYTPLVLPLIANGIHMRWVGRRKESSGVRLFSGLGMRLLQGLSRFIRLTQCTRSHSAVLHVSGGMLLWEGRISGPGDFHL